MRRRMKLEERVGDDRGTPVWRMPVLLTLLTLAACEGPAGTGDAEMTSSASGASSAMTEIQMDLEPLQEKILGFAEALDSTEYAWRPGEGVRSSGEVFMHIAAVNYAFPMMPGTPAPAGTGLSMDDFFGSMAEFERGATTREDILSTLRESFGHLETAMRSTEGSLAGEVDVFGTSTSIGGFWWMHLGHLHEHLGQLIAYGRVQDLAPPWSR